MTNAFANKFDGDTPALLDAIREHIAADEDGAFIPNSIGGKARRLLNAAAARLAKESARADGRQGYVDAFYEVCNLLGIPAMAMSPKEAWETVIRPKLAAALRTPAKTGGDVGRVAGVTAFGAECKCACHHNPNVSHAIACCTPPTQQEARAVDDTARLDWLSRYSNLQNEIVQHGYGSLRDRIDAALTATLAGDTAQQASP